MKRGTPNHLWLTFLVILSMDFFFQWLIRSEDLLHSLETSLTEAIILTILYFACTQKDIMKLSVLFLGIPYLFFIPGWLNMSTAILMGSILAFCFFRILSQDNDRSLILADNRILPAFLLIIIYINLSGIGGYGYQSPDYSMHNSRLSDLIVQDWPVKYATDKHLVYYSGYFLPAAIMGKLTSYGVASYFLYFWSILGLTLVFRWLQHLSGWRLTGWLVLIFMLFGSLDILNTTFYHHDKNESWGNILFPLDIGRFEFITREQIGFFLGNYLSPTLQLYFSPHQVIAGWIGIALITHLYLSKQPGQMFFVFSLLSLWSPFAMLGMGLLVLLAVMDMGRKHWRSIITFENTLGALSLCLLFITYYLGGSAEKNPSFSIFQGLDTWQDYLSILVFMISGWGIYVAIILPAIRQQSASHRLLFWGLVASLILLPCWVFGSYNDLFCRGAAPLMFLLLVYLLRAVKYYWQNQKRWVIIPVVIVFLASSLSALQQHTKAIYGYGESQAPTSVTGYKYSWENFGPDDSVFGKYFRAD